MAGFDLKNYHLVIEHQRQIIIFSFFTFNIIYYLMFYCVYSYLKQLYFFFHTLCFNYKNKQF